MTRSAARFDVVSVGSTMIRLTAPAGERLETAPYFEVRTAGTESNTLAALARLGRRTAWVSRLADNALGRRVAGEIGRFGVDVSRVVWTGEGRNELFFVEPGSPPRPTEVVYDRRPSALAEIKIDELDLDFLLDTRLLHLSGILPALSDNCRELAAGLKRKATEKGIGVSFDVNYRARLWPPAEARRNLEPLLAGVEVLVMTAEDARQVFGLSGPPERLAELIHRNFLPGLAAVTQGTGGAAACDGRELYRHGGHEALVIDRLGAGDAFMAGLLHGWLDGSVRKGLDYGTAMAALKLSLKGDYFVFTEDEVLRLAEAGPDREVGR